MKRVCFAASIDRELIPHTRFEAAGHARGIVQYD